MPSLRTPVYCPACGYLVEGASTPDESRRAAFPGAVCICLDCLELSIFDASMQLRRPSKEEFAAIVMSHGRDIQMHREGIIRAKAELGLSDAQPRN